MKTLALSLSIAALAGGALAQTTIASDLTLPAKGAFTVGQIEDADVYDSANKEVGEVEHVLLDPAGRPTAVVIELDRVGPDKRVVVSLAHVTVEAEAGDPDDYILRSELTKEGLLALPDWQS